ncbi:MAG: glycosyltransferase family 2 protein [Dehalococcoidales bacterium]|nr:glycosyltransferase family 2 protein [Dehalococcoidales bacterium]
MERLAKVEPRGNAAKKPKVTILICTFNEEQNLPHVLPKIPKWVDEVLLIDGHSADKTVAVAREFFPNIRIEYQPNKGKDDALEYGVSLATGDIVITLDADGNTDPEEIPNFIEPLLKGYDFVKGSRFLKTRPLKMPWYRRFGNWVLFTEINLLFGAKYTDVCSGYNAFWKSSWAKIEFPDEFGYEPLIIIRAKKAGLKILEITSYDKGRASGKSKLPSWRQGWGAFKAILKERFRV